MAVHPDEGTDQSDRGRHPPRRWTKWLWCIALICSLVAGLCWGALHYSRRHAFAKRVQAIRATGCPVTVTELDRWYKWPERGANAAALVLDAVSCYVAPSDSNAAEELWLVRRGQGARAEPLRDSARTMLTEYIRANAKALELLREAAATKDSRYPLDVNRGYAARLTYLGEVVNKAGILPCLEAILHAENGDPARAGEALRTALGVTRSLTPEPMLICQINRLTCQRIVLIALERVLSRTQGFTEAQLLALSEAVTAAYDPNGWTRALIGERCLLIGLYEQPGLADGPLPNSPLRRTIINTYKRRELGARSDIVFLDLMDRLMQV